LFEAEQQCTREPVVSALIEEIEAAATAANTEAERARMRVLDRTVVDAHKAHVALETATVRRDRLQAALLARAQRLQEV
jgi:flagellar hook-basal body complex protein FliE